MALCGRGPEAGAVRPWKAMSAGKRPAGGLGTLAVLGVQKAVLGGEPGGLATSGESELVQDTGDVVTCGVLADDQLRCYLLICKTVRHEGHYLPLTLG